MAQKNESRGQKASTFETGVQAGADIFQTVGQCIGEFQIGGGAGFLHVVAADADAVELGHPLASVGENIGDDADAGLGRINVGVANHELFENVVLNRADQLLRFYALLFGRDNIKRHDGEHGTVHRHRDAHFVQRNAFEQHAHVVDAVDGDAGHADVAG